jgi:hypothetical protein
LGLPIVYTKFLFPKESTSNFGLSYTPHKTNFFLWNLISPSQNNVETMKAPQNRRFYGMIECLPLWPNYIGEKGRTLAKTYGIKAR